MRFQTSVAALLLTGLGLGQTTGGNDPKQTETNGNPPVQAQSTPLFSQADRDAVTAFWNGPTRYTTTLPDDALTNGVWQVRLSVSGSTWLWNYQRGKRIPPTATYTPSTDEQRTWEEWVKAKLLHDRWMALQVAQQANQKLVARLVPGPDAATPQDEPPQPGPIPLALVAWAGDPPPFAEAVVPMQHTITFDDATIVYRDNVRLGSPRYPYYRFNQGVMSSGIPAKSMDPLKLQGLCNMAGIDDRTARIMHSVSMLEGGFDSVNTYDTGYVSVGFIQFATLKDGANSVGQLLKNYKAAYPDDFQQDFRKYGIDVTPDGVLDVIDLGTGAELTAASAARQIIDDKRLIAVFQRAGLRSDKYDAMQLKSAYAIYYPANDPISLSIGGVTVAGVVSDVVKSEAGMATLMDRKVNTGKLDAFMSAIQQLAAEVKPQTLADLTPYEHDIIAAVKYRRDYLADGSLSQPPASPPSKTFGGSGGVGRRRHSR